MLWIQQILLVREFSLLNQGSYSQKLRLVNKPY